MIDVSYPGVNRLPDTRALEPGLANVEHAATAIGPFVAEPIDRQAVRDTQAVTAPA